MGLHGSRVSGLRRDLLSPEKPPRIGRQQQDEIHDTNPDAVPPDIAFNDAGREAQRDERDHEDP